MVEPSQFESHANVLPRKEQGRRNSKFSHNIRAVLHCGLLSRIMFFTSAVHFCLKLMQQKETLFTYLFLFFCSLPMSLFWALSCSTPANVMYLDRSTTEKIKHSTSSCKKSLMPPRAEKIDVREDEKKRRRTYQNRIQGRKRLLIQQLYVTPRESYDILKTPYMCSLVVQVEI